jgi:hypothetical protein
MPFACPRIVTETFYSGFSLSSSTFPETKADLFWEKEAVKSKMQNAVRNIWRNRIFISEFAFKIQIVFANFYSC